MNIYGDVWRNLFSRNRLSELCEDFCDASSRIQVNCSLTNSISLRNSVRQGYPLSMILFVIHIEPLLRRIAKEAQDVVVGKDDITALAYADDINYIAQDDEECDRVSLAISRVCIESNTKVNLSKILILE
jgi:hypothetical protein